MTLNCIKCKYDSVILAGLHQTPLEAAVKVMYAEWACANILHVLNIHIASTLIQLKMNICAGLKPKMIYQFFKKLCIFLLPHVAY